MKREIWKDIKGYEELYQVSNYGRVRSIGGRRGCSNSIKILKQGTDTSGYKMVILRVYKKSKTFKVHRLVYEAFNGVIPEGYEINHINEIKIDNRIENLNLMTHRENVNWGTGKQRSAENRKGIEPWNKNKKMDKSSCEKMSISRTGKGNWKSKKVYQYSIDDVYINSFESACIAAKETNSDQRHISDCCLGRRKTHNGFKWSLTLHN